MSMKLIPQKEFNGFYFELIKDAQNSIWSKNTAKKSIGKNHNPRTRTPYLKLLSGTKFDSDPFHIYKDNW